MHIGQIISTFALISVGSTLALGQTTPATQPDILAMKVAPCFTRVQGDEPGECVHIKHVSLGGLLLDSLSWHEPPIPVGLALYPGDDGMRRFNFNPKGPKVRDILESIVSTNHRYKWSIEKGIINVTPRDGIPQLLEVTLAEFNRQNTITEVLFESLEHTPEVQKRAFELGFAGPHLAFPWRGAIDLRKFSIECRNCTVRYVLNEISRQSGG
jgi:hypothetical protein